MRLVSCLIIALLLVAGCAAKEYVESSEAEAFLKKDPAAAGAVSAVREYNRQLISVYQHNDVAPLKSLVVERELNKMKHLTEGLQSKSLMMEAQLKQMRVERVERWGQENVVVYTSEKWHYRRVNTVTWKEELPFTDVEYHMIYKMVNWDGRWQLFNLAPASDKG